MSVALDFAVRRGDFSLELSTVLEPGTVVAVLGPNGAGKTTVVRAIAGLQSIDRGTIRMHDQVVDQAGGAFIPAQQRSVGVVFQDYALFPHLTVQENVAFGPRSRGMGAKEARAASMRLLERMEIAGLAQRRPREISGGQAQRVALARALATEPQILLLDEPLAALDAETREAVRVELERHLGEFDGCVLLVTHDPLDALLLADRVLVLEGGRLVQDGAPAELARRPATPYVATLMGVNLLRGDARDGQLAVDGGGVVRIADRSLSGRAVAVIRPEAVTLHRHEPEGSARNTWFGTVASVLPLQDRVRVHVDGHPPVIATVTPDAVADLHLARGAHIWASVKAVDVDAFAAPAH